MQCCHGKSYFHQMCEQKPHKTEEWAEWRLEISLGCPNLGAFLEKAVPSCLYDRNEKNERSRPIPSIFLLNEKTCLKSTEQIFQINDDLLNEE